MEYKNRKKFKNANKSSGGIALFAKHKILDILEPFNTKNKDIIWLKLKKQYHNNPNDIYLGSVYLSEENGTQSILKKISNLSDDIELIKNKGGDILIQGDLNARTSLEKDFLPPNKFDHDLEIDLDVDSFDLPERNSTDRIINKKGRELLELCIAYNLCIVNGRKTGDHLGNLTSYQAGGNSVIDYAIASQTIFQNISSFKVGDYKPWISDHCAIHHTIDIGYSNVEHGHSDELDIKPSPTSWYWDHNSNDKFQTILNNDESLNRLEEIRNLADGDVMVKELNSFLRTTAKKCGIKKKQRQPFRESQPPWFDRECLSLKNKIKEYANKIQKSPNNLTHRESMLTLKKRFKHIVKKKKTEFKDDIINKMTNNRQNSRKFWNLMKKLDFKLNEDTFKKSIPSHRWTKHFTSVLSTRKDSYIPKSPIETGCPDYDISLAELETSSYILRPGKASGIDEIPYEMILCLLKTNPQTILKLFNKILSSAGPITTWNTSILSPIHKKGSKTDPDNYRAIALSCCLSKFFASVLNQRLLNFCIENNIIAENQLGFMPGNRTSDALIILYNLFNKYCKQNKYIYACFVDFKKAFDSVPRHILFEKLLSYNITGKFYNSIRNMYIVDLACVSIGNQLTNSFRMNQGVKQGCILSPLLFNIFLSDLPDTLGIGESNPVFIDQSKTLNSLIWADDLLLLSETEIGLNTLLKNLEKYTKANLIQVNLKKTNCMIFNKTGRLIRRNFWYQNEKIEIVREYKYLGFLITPSLNLTLALKDLKDRGLRAYGALKTKLGNLFLKDIPTTINLFDALIKPILLYASDFWGILKIPKTNPLETFHLRFCKDLLGVQVQTSNLGVLLELGRVPLTTFGKKNAIKNWERICINKKANKIVTASYNDTQEKSWTEATKFCFSRIGLLDVFLNQTPSKAPNLILFHRELDIFQQKSLTEITNMSKLRTYTTIKNNIKFEKYLTSVRNIPNRIALTKFRLSNHTLMIESGRYENIHQLNRKCPFCPDKIENEIHLLINCPIYSNLRLSMLGEIEKTIIGFYYPYDENFLFWFMLSNPLIAQSTAEFIKLAMDLREFLLKKPRNSN